MNQSQRQLVKHSIFRAAASLEAGLRGRPAASADDLRQIRNFLFLQFDTPLGSIVHATPLFAALRQAIPDAFIAVAASTMAAAVLAGNPFIDRCLVIPSPFESLQRSSRALRPLLKFFPGPCCVATTIGNQRSRIALLALTAGRCVRAGYTVAPELYTLPLRFNPERGQIAGNLDILRVLGFSVPAGEPQVFFTAKDFAHAAGLLAHAGPAPRIAFITQNSGGQPNQWSPDRFREIAEQLYATHRAAPIFVGALSEAPAIEIIREGLSERGISAAGKTSIPQLAALLSQCDLAVSLDTGAFHVARAVGLPGIVLAPAWQSAREWLPIEDPQYCVLQGPRLPAAPAGYWIEEIDVPQVFAAAQDLLSRYPPLETARRRRAELSLDSAALRQ